MPVRRITKEIIVPAGIDYSQISYRSNIFFTDNYATLGALVGGDYFLTNTIDNKPISDYMCNGNPFELGLKCSWNTSGLMIVWCFNELSYPQAICVWENRFRVLTSLNAGGSWANETYINAGAYDTIHWVKYTWDGETYSFSISTDGENFTTTTLFSSTSCPTIPTDRRDNLLWNNINGPNANIAYQFTGKLYLDGCYFKSNGNIVWKPYRDEPIPKTITFNKYSY